MSAPILILRPRPAADATAERVLTAGLTPLLHPLFALRAVEWSPPDEPATALLLTSANAVRLAGPLPERLATLPAFTVGPATAAAARAARLSVAFAGRSDGAEAVLAAAAAEHRTLIHLRGETARALPSVARVVPVVTYAAEPIATPLPLLPPGTVALLHSPRAAALFAQRIGEDRAALAIVAISANAAEAAGSGWRRVEVAKRPTDGAMLAAAVSLAAGPIPEDPLET